MRYCIYYFGTPLVEALRNTMKMKIFTIASLAIVLGLSSCRRESSSDVNQDRIYQEYSVEYDDEKQETEIRAFYRLGDANGTRLELEPPSKVELDGYEMDWQNSWATYKAEFDYYKSYGTLSFTNNDGVVFNNYYSFNIATNVPYNLSSITKGSSYRFYWDGPALGSNETITVKIEGIGESVQVNESSYGATSVNFSQSKISQISEGDARISLVRTKKANLQSTTNVGGEINYKFTSRTKNIRMQ